MNKDYKLTYRMFRPYPFLTRRQWSTILLLIGGYVVGMSTLKTLSIAYIDRPKSGQKLKLVELYHPFILDKFKVDQDFEKIRTK